MKIIHDFIQFSPDIEYEDLERFMENKFNITSPWSGFKASYKANQVKYAPLLKRFLQSIYTIDDIDIKVLHYNKKNKIGKDIKAMMTHQDVFCAYENLISLGQIQDAVILYTIYSLSINPYSIFLLTFEGIKDNLLIEYWNHKSGQMDTLNVSKELLNDLNYYKKY